MKILVVHQYYLGPGEPGGSRFNEMARFWKAAGHDVTVVAGSLNYTTNEVPERLRGRWTVRGVEEGVMVWRCYVPASYGRSYPGRMWAFFGFTLSAVTAVLRAARADVIVATSPPLVTAIPGWMAARLRRRRAPWIFEIRDLWPESAVTTGVLKPDGLLTRLLYSLERWACRSATRVNVLTPAFRDDLVARGLAPEKKIAFIPNGADVEAFRPGPRDNDVRRQFGWGDRTVFLYAGAHGRANAVGQLLEAAEGLRHRADILIATVGDGPERADLQSEARRRGLANILFHGAQAKARMPDCVNACDVGVAVLKNSPTFRTVYPNKVFDYMACERPTLLAIDGVARRLVCDEARAGLYAPPEDGPALARAMIQMADDREERAAMGRRGLAWVMANATRESLARRYLDLMREIVSA
jgi:glycosyltransferase involved in cell wall biosynthesis